MANIIIGMGTQDYAIFYIRVNDELYYMDISYDPIEDMYLVDNVEPRWSYKNLERNLIRYRQFLLSPEATENIIRRMTARMVKDEDVVHKIKLSVYKYIQQFLK